MYQEQINFLGKKIARVVFLLSLTFFVYACGTSDDSFTDTLTDFETKQADALPFAFDVDVDHIGYMSCESDSLRTDASPYFNFKAGAFNSNTGVKFRENFFSLIGSLSKNKRKLSEYLAVSKRNAETGVVMSIRTAGDFRVPFQFASDPLATNFISGMLWEPGSSRTLTNPGFISLMFENASGVNYFSGLPGAGKNKTLDTRLSFNGIGAQDFVRSALQNDSYLSFTFATSAKEEPGVAARSPFDEDGLVEDAKTSIFGKGYKMTFAQIDSLRISSPQGVLSGVQGFNLENNATSNGEVWNCPPDERYIVVRPEDARRRYDVGPATRPDGDDDDTAPDVNNPWDDNYNDGGRGTGGYYMEYLTEDPANPGTNIKVKHKVICPTIPDNMLVNESEHSNHAWKRVRSLLSVKDWYVFRGNRYNCIVPKNDDKACYGAFENTLGSNADPTDNLIQEIRYFRDEDSIDKKIADNKFFLDTIQANPDSTIKRKVYDSIADCESTNGNGSFKFCPKIFSICYKQ